MRISWRPKDWKHPFASYLYAIWNELTPEQCCEHNKNHAFEVGAEAMLEAIKQLGYKDAKWVPIKMGVRRMYGTTVFIPNEGEEDEE